MAIKGPATIYVAGEIFGNYQKIEVREVSTHIVRHAQYAKAVDVRFRPKGARRLRGFVQTSGPSVVILKGHGHFEPDALTEGSGPVRIGRHTGHDSQWRTEFRAKLAAHVKASGAEVVLDLHQHNPCEAF